MSSPFIGEIRLFAGNFAPLNWALCNGQTMAISQNAALFQLIGTTYGGDGQTTFNLPDLRGRLPIHQGTSPGGNFVVGQVAGTETVTLTTNQIPAHSHPASCDPNGATSPNPMGTAWGNSGLMQYSTQTTYSPMGTSSTATGGGQPHDNTVPFLAVNFIIALFGVFPTQN